MRIDEVTLDRSPARTCRMPPLEECWKLNFTANTCQPGGFRPMYTRPVPTGRLRNGARTRRASLRHRGVPGSSTAPHAIAVAAIVAKPLRSMHVRSEGADQTRWCCQRWKTHPHSGQQTLAAS